MPFTLHCAPQPTYFQKAVNALNEKNCSVFRSVLLLIALTFSLGLTAGCTSSGRPLGTEEPHSVPVSQAMAVPPSGTLDIIGIVETRYVNAVEQKIALETRSRSPGQNFIHIRKFDDAAKTAPKGGVQDIPLASMQMAGEARGAVSFADMRHSNFLVHNTYNYFGYSMGRTAEGETCMYAWQRLEPSVGLGARDHRGAVVLRMQVCDREYTEQKLLSLMINLTLPGVSSKPEILAAATVHPGNILPPISGSTRASAPRPSTSSSTTLPTPTGPSVPTPGATGVPAPTTNIVVPAPAGAGS